MSKFLKISLVKNLRCSVSRNSSPLTSARTTVNSHDGDLEHWTELAEEMVFRSVDQPM